MDYEYGSKDEEVEKIKEIKTVDDIVVYAFKQIAISQRKLDIGFQQLDFDNKRLRERFDDIRHKLEEKSREVDEWKTKYMNADDEAGILESKLKNLKKKMKKAKK